MACNHKLKYYRLRMLPITTTEIKHKIGTVLEDGGNYMRKDESSKILSNEWKELIVEDEKTKEKLVIINSDGVEITSSDLNVRLVPKE